MIDEEIRRLERALAADPSDTVALEALAAARTRAGRGWADEPLPLDLRCSPRSRGVYVWERRGLGLELVRVPATPPRHVGVDWSSGRASSDHTLPGDPAFYVGRYPVTNREWRLPTPDGGRILRVHHVSQADHPVVEVTHADALAFCAWAGLRLPTAAEWTRAAGMDERSPCHLPGDLTPHDPRHHRDCSICDGEGRLPRRKFPWGNEEPTPERCVSAWWRERESDSRLYGGLGHLMAGARSTRPVRDADGRPARPAGASPCGAMDMVGHVFEFAFVAPYVHELMGSSFRRQREDIITATADGADDLGFRVVLPAPEAAP